MNKVICDICGTTYSESAECCPICGCTRDSAAEILGDDLLQEGTGKNRGGRFAPKKKEIFDFDEVNAESEDYDEEEEEDYDEEEEEEEAPRHNTFVVILLTVLIAGLLIAAGFIFVRFFLPNMKAAEETAPVASTAAAIETTAAATEATIPCDTLIITSGAVAELNEVGQHFLLHIKAMPEDTTDKIIYTSGDENVATVSEDGKITAVAEGETKVYISCGKSSLECPVIVKFVEETVPPTTEAEMEETVPETTIPVVEAVDPDVVLKLKQTDIQLGVYYGKQLELDCNLKATDVEWISEHPHIAKVDENGLVTALKAGTTGIIAKYGDQEVQCIIRCYWP